MRFCTEHKVKLSKIFDIFCTEITPESVGGLAGLMLTMADSGHKSIQLHGPRNFLQYLFSLRPFMKR